MRPVGGPETLNSPDSLVTSTQAEDQGFHLTLSPAWKLYSDLTRRLGNQIPQMHRVTAGKQVEAGVPTWRYDWFGKRGLLSLMCSPRYPLLEGLALRLQATSAVTGEGKGAAAPGRLFIRCSEDAYLTPGEGALHTAGNYSCPGSVWLEHKGSQWTRGSTSCTAEQFPR